MSSSRLRIDHLRGRDLPHAAEPGTAAGREEIFKVWVEGGFGSERFDRLRCIVTHANMQPGGRSLRVPAGDSIWRALALDVLRIEDDLITEIVTLPPDTFSLFGLPILSFS
jgi:RNA polymerase sigma-70 factor (ECF subfamily)